MIDGVVGLSRHLAYSPANDGAARGVGECERGTAHGLNARAVNLRQGGHSDVGAERATLDRNGRQRAKNQALRHSQVLSLTSEI